MMEQEDGHVTKRKRVNDGVRKWIWEFAGPALMAELANVTVKEVGRETIHGYVEITKRNNLYKCLTI